jgi:tetratricopeptide (TPR) repeat protein
MLAEEQGDQILEGATLLMLGALSAMAQCFAPAQALAARGVDIFTELGLELRLALAREFTALIPLLAGDLEGAEHELRLGVEIGTRLDAESQLSTIHGMLADILCVQGRFAEAVPYAEQARETARDDLFAQVLSRRAAAKIDAGNGNLDLAAQALREAADVAAGTDALNLRADVEVDLAHVLLAHGRRNEPAVEALETALELYRQKENDAAIARTESALAIAGQARNVARLDHR